MVADKRGQNEVFARIFTFSQRYSTQFTAENMVVFKMHDLLKKNCSRYRVFSGSTFLKFPLRFHAQSVLILCKCVTFFNKAALLRQNIDDAWKRSRFNRG